MKTLDFSGIDANDTRLKHVYGWLKVVDDEFDDNGKSRVGDTILAIPKHLRNLVKDKTKILSLPKDKLKNYLLTNHYNAYNNIR
ncbi:hypothetical protein ACVWU4_000903 [Campylobacter coli]